LNAVDQVSDGGMAIEAADTKRASAQNLWTA
jgi:hypothetical protein